MTLFTLAQTQLSWLKIFYISGTFPGITSHISHLLWEATQSLKIYTDESIWNIQWKNNSIAFLSNDDPYIDFQSAKDFYGSTHNAQIISFQNKGHFNTTAWVLDLPEIFTYI